VLDAVVPPDSALSARVTAVLQVRDAPADIMSVLMNLPERVSEVILVGGPFPADAAALTHSTKAHIRAVEQQAPGKEAAFACGFAAAEGEIVVMLDVDSDASNLERFISALESGADFVSGAGKLAEDATTSLT
jgi:hypothetical protein